MHMPQHAGWLLTRRASALGLAGLLALSTLSGCKKIEENLGASPVTGSAGSAGTQGEAASLQKCDAPIATVALVENPAGYGPYISKYNLPESPVPLLRLLMQQTGCFRVVDRNAGLKTTIQEKELSEGGLTRENTTIKKRQVIEAQYALTPNLVFSEKDAGGSIGGIMGMIPFLNKFVGLAEQVKFKEAQVVLFLTDNETTEQLGSAEGSAKATDLGLGGLAIGKTGGAAGMGWGNTNEGKMIAGAFLNAVNKLVPQVQVLAAKELPAAVKTKTAPVVSTAKH